MFDNNVFAMLYGIGISGRVGVRRHMLGAVSEDKCCGRGELLRIDVSNNTLDAGKKHGGFKVLFWWLFLIRKVNLP